MALFTRGILQCTLGAVFTHTEMLRSCDVNWDVATAPNFTSKRVWMPVPELTWSAFGARLRAAAVPCSGCIPIDMNGTGCMRMHGTPGHSHVGKHDPPWADTLVNSM